MSQPQCQQQLITRLCTWVIFWPLCTTHVAYLVSMLARAQNTLSRIKQNANKLFTAISERPGVRTRCAACMDRWMRCVTWQSPPPLHGMCISSAQSRTAFPRMKYNANKLTAFISEQWYACPKCASNNYAHSVYIYIYIYMCVCVCVLHVDHY